VPRWSGRVRFACYPYAPDSWNSLAGGGRRQGRAERVHRRTLTAVPTSLIDFHPGHEGNKDYALVTICMRSSQSSVNWFRATRTFILTLDTVQHGHNLISFLNHCLRGVLTPPTLPGFYPHSDGPLRARCILGFDLKPRSITTMMDLGCWDAAIYRAISKGSGGLSQSSEQGGGCDCHQPSRSRSSRNEQNRFVFSLYAAAGSVIIF
jgi:hypothetical protein